MTTDPDGDREYTIDELAAATQVPSRTIRFYQSKGALPRPQIRGRVAYYGPAHVERLKLIASLQDRGLRIDAIRDLTARIDKGELDVNEWLGLEAELEAPWANDQPRTVSEAELYELAGTRRPGLLADLARTKLVKRHGDTYFVPSPALLHLVTQLESLGIDLEAAVSAGEMLRKHMARAAEDLAEHFFRLARGAPFRASREPLDRSSGGDDAASVLDALRPLGMEAVRVIFGQEMERVLRKLVASGKTASLASKGKRSSSRRD